MELIAYQSKFEGRDPVFAACDGSHSMIRITAKSYCNLTRGGPGKDGVQIFQWDPPRIEYVIANRLLPEARGLEQYGSPMSADMSKAETLAILPTFLEDF